MTDYIWKGPKKDGAQEEFDLRDQDLETLKKCYDFCQQMLYNKDKKTPGRMVLIDTIKNQIQHCRAELLVRWLRADKGYTYQHCYEDIYALICNNKGALTQDVIETYPISSIMSEIPSEYRRVPIGLVLKAALGSLGLFDVSYITLNFLCKIGIYLTQKELQDTLFERDPATGKAKNRMQIIKEREGISPDVRIECNPEGLTYEEFHLMIKIHSDKYENFTTKQLKLLSEKILYRYIERCDRQANGWLEKLSIISDVAKEKGWDINTSIQVVI